jgi:HEAT repeat protein
LPAALAEQVRKLQSHDAAIRFEAVDELVRSKNAAVLPHLLPVANDPDPFVRRVTMDGLAGFRQPEAVDVLLSGLGDGDENVRDTAWRSLREVTGQKFAFDAFNPSKEVRARAQQRWQEWWDKNKATFGS